MGDFGILGGAARKFGASCGLNMNLWKIIADPFVCLSVPSFFNSDRYESAAKTERPCMTEAKMSKRDFSIRAGIQVLAVLQG